MPSLSADNNVTVQIQTKADLEGVNQTKSGLQGLNKDTEESSTKGMNWGGSLKTAGLMAAGALAGVVKVGGDMVDSFNDSAKYGAALTAVLKSTGGQAGITQQAALDLSKQIEHSTGLGDEAVLSAENMLLTFTNIGKDAFPGATQAVTDWATAMNGGAIPNADQMRDTAIQLGKALQDPDKGLGALHRVGVNTDELAKKFTAGMSVQEKQKLILQELGNEFGGQAAAQMNTYAGKQAHLKEQVDDVKESMGEIIVKAMTPLQGAFDKLVPYLQKAADWFAGNKTAVVAVAGAIGGLLLGVIIAAAIAIGWIPLAIVAGAAIIGAIVGVIVQHFQTIKNFVMNVVDKIKGAFDTAMNWIMDKVNWLKDNWLEALGFIIGFFATLPIKLPIFIFDAFNAIIHWLMGINWGGIFSGIGNAIAGVAGDIWTYIQGAFHKITSLNWGQITINVGKDLGNALVDLLQGALNGALKGIPGHPHVNLPHFASGVRNFGGGWAIVGDDPMNSNSGELVNLPRGSNVYSNKESKAMLGGAGATINNYGDNHFYTAAAVAEYFNQQDHDAILLSKGLSPARGMN